MLRVTLTLVWQRDVPVVGLGRAAAVLGTRGARSSPGPPARASAGQSVPSIELPAPGLGFLQASPLTFHTFKESSAAPFFPIVFLAP